MTAVDDRLTATPRPPCAEALPLPAPTIAAPEPAADTVPAPELLPVDVVPGITGSQLYDLLPRDRSGRFEKGSGHSRTFSHLKDPRTRHVSRASVEKVATVDDVELPQWLDIVLERQTVPKS